jgi:hypothetical protein
MGKNGKYLCNSEDQEDHVEYQEGQEEEDGDYEFRKRSGSKKLNIQKISTTGISRG